MAKEPKKAKVRKPRAQAFQQVVRRVAEATAQPPPLTTMKEAEAEYAKLAQTWAAYEAADQEREAAEARAERLFEDAVALAERIRAYVDTFGVPPEANGPPIGFASGTYTMVQSHRESAFLEGKIDSFLAEARKHRVVKRFVRFKPEPNLQAFKLHENRALTSLFKSAKIVKARRLEFRIRDAKTFVLAFPLDDPKKKWRALDPTKKQEGPES